MSDVVKFGADAREYFEVTDAMKAAHDKLGEHLNRNSSRAAEGHERLLVSSHRVASQFDKVANVLASGGGAADVAATAFEGLGHALHLPIGELALIGTLAIGIDKLGENAHEASLAARAMYREFEKKPATTVGLLSETGIIQQLEKERELVKKFEEKSSGISGSANVLLGINQSRDQIREEGRRRSQLLQEQLRNRSGETTSVAAQSASGDERNADKLNVTLASEERIAAILTSEVLTKRTKTALVDEENARLQIQLGLVDKIHDAKAREVELIRTLSDIQVRSGDDTGVDSARAKQAAALKELDAAKNSGTQQEQDAASAKVAAAGAELDAALQLRDVQRDIYRLSLARTAIGRLVSSQSVDATPEERQRLALQGQQQIAQQALATANERYKKAEGEGRLTDRIRSDQAQASGEAQAAADALTVFDKERAFNHEQTLNAAQSTTREMELQASGADHLARLAQIASTAEQKRAQYLHDGRGDLAEQVTAQEKISKLQEKANELAKSPQQKYQEAVSQSEKERNLRTAAAQEKDETDRHRRGSYTDGGRPGPLSDADFHKQFKPLSDQAAQHREATAAHAETKDKHDTGTLITRVDTLLGTLNALPGKVGVL